MVNHLDGSVPEGVVLETARDVRGNPFRSPPRPDDLPIPKRGLNNMTINPILFYNPVPTPMYRPESPTSESQYVSSSPPSSPPTTYRQHMGWGSQPSDPMEDLERMYDVSASKEKDLRPVEVLGSPYCPTAASYEVYRPVECPLFLQRQLFRPVGPCTPTRRVREQITSYYEWVAKCLRGASPAGTPDERRTYEVAERNHRPGLLGDNDDPDAFWEPNAQITLYPPPTLSSPYPLRADAVPVAESVASEEIEDSVEEGLAWQECEKTPWSIYQLPIPLPGEVDALEPRQHLYYHLAAVQPSQPRDPRTGFRPVRRTARFRFLLTE